MTAQTHLPSKTTRAPLASRIRHRVAAASVFLAALSLVGCEENVDPFVGTDLPFTIWGFLNASSDTQYVRVFPISDELVPADETIDARVFSMDLETGEEREWRYEKVRFDSLIQGHIFWSPFLPQHNRRYRLEVVRSDGATSSVSVTVPSPVEFAVDADVEGSTIVPIRVTGDVPNLVGASITYNAVNVPPAKAWPVGTTVADPVQLPVTIIYDQVLKPEPDGWSLEVNMSRDFSAVETIYRFNCLITPDFGSAPDIWLRDIEFTALAADSTWSPPGGRFDPNLLAVPGTFSNVENGYGFFGAGMGIHFAWTPTVEVAQAAGYDFEVQCNYLAPVDS
ncbi:MAG: hypothetical protein R3282_03960, partial [Rhodothermales bacterium]|nr:hypothetical protein [Rhodothermales bacterium]